ncbi:MAG: glutathione transferase GstA, partial [Lysobacterales bacterium]
YYTINPKGQVPLLQLDDGTRLSEGPVIAQYIADQSGNTKLMLAAGGLARYRVMEWQSSIISELHKSFTPLFNAVLIAPAPRVRSYMSKRIPWASGKLAP